MGGDLDHSDFVDPDYERLRQTGGATPAFGTATGPSAGTRPMSRDEITQQVTAAQQALVELKRRQEDLERERAQLEEARRRRIEYEQGREEMLTHLTRGIALLDEAEQSSRRDAEQMSRSLADLRTALDKVSSLNETSWTAEAYHSELTKALTTLESARMEWNSAQVKWPVLTSKASTAGAGDPLGASPDESAPLFQGKSPGELARLGLALTWPVALAVLAVGITLAIVLTRR
ncbi:MAG: hypothetical protein AB7O66_12245 [Limisphaerales bacterium]